MATPTIAERPCTAFTIVKFLLEPDVGGELTNHTHCLSPNLAAYPQIDSVILEKSMVFPTKEAMAQLEFVAHVGSLAVNYAGDFAEAKGQWGAVGRTVPTAHPTALVRSP